MNRHIEPGYHVRLHESAAVDGHRDAVIERVDGNDVYLSMNIMGFRVVDIHRYIGEFEVIATDPETIAAAAEKDRLDKINLEQMISTCPAERLIAEALEAAGIPFQHEGHPDRQSEPEGKPKLDFKIGDNLFIEVKQMHTPRVERQLASAENVILVQGMKAARWLADAIKKGTAA